MATKANKKIIFSSGFAYGKILKIDASYNFICVRGPLTAQADSKKQKKLRPN